MSSTLDMTRDRAMWSRWQDQSHEYGSQFAAIYERLFPRSSAVDAIRFLTELARSRGHDCLGRTTSRPARFAEFGVGDGRVALGLALAGGCVQGVDLSEELLAVGRRRAVADGVAFDLDRPETPHVEFHRGDMLSWSPSEPVELAYCVCATISMLQTPQDQGQLLSRMAETVRPGAAVVVETHNPARIRELHRDLDEVSFRTVVAGLPGGLGSTSRLAPDRRHWMLAHEWRDPDLVHAREFSLLVTPGELDELAQPHGLKRQLLLSSWTRAPYHPMSPTYIAVFRKTA